MRSPGLLRLRLRIRSLLPALFLAFLTSSLPSLPLELPLPLGLMPATAAPAPEPVAPVPAPAFFPVASSPDGTLTAERSSGRAFRVRAGDQVLWQRDDLKISDHQTAIFSPDGRLVVTLGWQTQLWDARTGVLKATLHKSDFPTITGAIAPDGKTLAAGSWDAIIRFWNIETAELLGEWKNSGGAIKRILWLDEGKSLLVNLYHNQTDTFRAQAQANALLESGGLVRRAYPGGEQLWRSLPHEGEINEIVLAPQGNRLLTSGADGQVFLWDIASGENHLLHITPPHWTPFHLEFSHDGKLALVAWKNDVWLYRLPMGKVTALTEVTAPPDISSPTPRAASVQPAAHLELAGWKQIRLSSDAQAVIDPQTGQSVLLEGAFAQRGELLRVPGVAAAQEPLANDEVLTAEEQLTEEKRLTAQGMTPVMGGWRMARRLDGWRAIAFAADRQTFVALPRNSQDPYIYLWNQRLTHITHRFRHPLTHIDTIEIAPDSRTLWITGSLEYGESRHLKGRVVRLDLKSGQFQLLAAYPTAPHFRGMPTAAISPDYTAVAYVTRELTPDGKEKSKTRARLGDEDYFSTLHVVDVASGQPLWQRTEPLGEAAFENVRALALGPRRETRHTLVLLRQQPNATAAAPVDEFAVGTDEGRKGLDVTLEAYEITPGDVTVAPPAPTVGAPQQTSTHAVSTRRVEPPTVDPSRRDAWRSLWRASDSDLQAAFTDSSLARGTRYGAAPSTLVLSPNGTWLATPGGLWEISTGHLRWRWPQSSRLLWSPDSQWLWLNDGYSVSNFDVAHVDVARVETGTVKETIKFRMEIRVGGSLIGVAPDGKRFAADNEATLAVWEREPGP